MNQAVLFDLDGTLLNTIVDLANACNQALEEAGFPGHPPEAYKQFVGNGPVTLMRRALPAGFQEEETVNTLLASFRNNYRRNLLETTVPYPGINTLLEELTARGVPLAVNTNKPQSDAEKCISHFFPDTPFEAVIGVRDGVPPKPDPAGAREILLSWKLPPHTVLYAGDSKVDMQTAAAAGCVPVGVTWGFRESEELREAGASVLLRSPAELLPLLER